MNNDDKIRDFLNEPQIPEELSPERIREMLEKEAPVKKRAGIKKTAMRITAGAAACAVICGGAVYAGKNGMISRDGGSSASEESSEMSSAEELAELAPYMSSASDYAEVYQLFQKSHEKNQKKIEADRRKYSGSYTNSAVYDDEMDYAEESFSAEAPAMNSDEIGIADGEGYGSGPEETTPEFSETHDQEEGVREADKVKTDGKYIYYLTNTYDEERECPASYLRIAEAKDGEFIGSNTLDLTPEVGADEAITEVSAFDMYVYDDMIAIIGTTYNYHDIDELEDEIPYYNYWGKSQCFVSFYTTGMEPELIGTYYQDGYFSDVRIAPDGYMYLLSNYGTRSFEEVDEENVEQYIPVCGLADECEVMPAEDILMPDDCIEPTEYLNYTVVTSFDLNTPGEFAVASQKALAGCSGNIYCSADNLYTTIGYEDTSITRIAIGGGEITPMASGTVEGYVNDQFSMSEYNGYFRVATTRQKWNESGNFITDMFGIPRSTEYVSDNMVYVLDLDMNQVGYIDNFGKNETIKSVNFSGDLAYVVTYERTDPLFAIDLSDPTNPLITDSFKILGYSSYMEKWDEGLLFGFGADADANGVETGVKAVMFDNSDPENLQEVGKISFNSNYSYDDYSGYWVSSPAQWDRKALLLAPEKNLICIPLNYNDHTYDSETDTYNYRSWSEIAFLAYENGDFTLRAELELGDYVDPVDRAVYIGDYIYALSGKKFTAIDYYSLDVTDTIEF